MIWFNRTPKSLEYIAITLSSKGFTMDKHCRKLIDEIEAVNARLDGISDRGSHEAETKIQIVISSAWSRIAALAKAAERALT